MCLTKEYSVFVLLSYRGDGEKQQETMYEEI